MSYYFINMPEDKGKKYEQFTYPAGETQVRILDTELEELTKHEGIVVTARITDGNPFPLSLLVDALSDVMFCPKGMNLILPYFPYSRADRKFTQGDCLALRTFCEVVNSLYVSRVVTLDAHSNATGSHLLDSFVNVRPDTLINTVVSSLDVSPTILLPDEGSLIRYDQVRYDQSQLGHRLIASCKKHRDAATGKLSHFEVPHIETPTALIVDDICDGGATFIGIAQKLKEQQPEVKLYLYVSHGIFSKGVDELKKYFEHIYTTNSLYGEYQPTAYWDSNYVTVFPIDGLLKASFLGTTELFQQVDSNQEARQELNVNGMEK